MCIPPGPAVTNSSVANGDMNGSIQLKFDSEEHQGPSGTQQQEQQQQLGAHSHILMK